MDLRAQIDAVHRMAATPSPADHDVPDPHPYCFGDDPCVCIQLIAACETAVAVSAHPRTHVADIRDLYVKDPESGKILVTVYPDGFVTIAYKGPSLHSAWGPPTTAEETP